MNIVETFYSIQGEGPYTGRSSLFIRFSGCNLHCQWGEHKCDTPYTSWEPEKGSMTMDEVVKKIQSLCHDCKHVVITGGEPTMYATAGSNGRLNRLCTTLNDLGYILDIETNGTGPIPPEVRTIVCSPKLSDSTPVNSSWEKHHEKKRKQLHSCITSFYSPINCPRPEKNYGITSSGNPRNNLNQKLFLKFVVGKKTNIDELKGIANNLFCPNDHVYLMPEGLTTKDILANSPKVAALALKLGYNFSTRLHVLLWDAKRGI